VTLAKRTVILAPVASDDVAGILDYALATVGLEAALAIDRRLDEAILSLEQLATRGRVVPELRQRGIVIFREIVTMPYRVVYRVQGEDVWIVAVVDHRRDLDAVLYERARR
jgi:plasmid stabilization system protein ParE